MAREGQLRATAGKLTGRLQQRGQCFVANRQARGEQRGDRVMRSVTLHGPALAHTATLDGVIQVTEEDAYAYAVRAAREEGIFVGPSSGASLAAVAQKLPDIADSSTVLTFCYDTGERYFSVEGLFSADGTDVQVGTPPA